MGLIKKVTTYLKLKIFEIKIISYSKESIFKEFINRKKSRIGELRKKEKWDHVGEIKNWWIYDTHKTPTSEEEHLFYKWFWKSKNRMIKLMKPNGVVGKSNIGLKKMSDDEKSNDILRKYFEAKNIKTNSIGFTESEKYKFLEEWVRFNRWTIEDIMLDLGIIKPITVYKFKPSKGTDEIRRVIARMDYDDRAKLRNDEIELRKKEIIATKTC